MGGTKIERIQLEHRIIFLPLTGTATVSRQMTQITPTTTGKYTIALLSVLAMSENRLRLNKTCTCA